MSKNKKGSGLGGVISWAAVTAFFVAFLIVLNMLVVPETSLYHSIVGTMLGLKKPIMDDTYEKIYVSDYESKAAAVEAGNKLNLQIEQEGAVLLVNEDNALPIARGSKVSVFGKNSVNLVLGGSGSGSGTSKNTKTLFDGLTAGGIEYNPTLKSFYESSDSGKGRSNNPALTEGSSGSPTLDIGETPMSSYTAAVKNSYSEYSDAAIVVISRLGGESWDLPRTQQDDATRHYLQLDKNEEALLDEVTARFDKVIVMLNTLTAFQCDFVAQYNNTPSDPRIDAVLWIGGPGATGAEAIGSLLNGEANPSGRTVDIYAADYTKDPTWQNFGDGSQTTENGTPNTAFLGSESADSAISSAYNMVTYEEGVYLGYRYYETRAYEEAQDDPSSAWYEENVVFPFGYGLSYTTFNQTITNVSGTLADSSSVVTISVEVENTGSVAGKEVVELYVSKPYYAGGIEKSYVELVDYAKTKLLAAGEKQTVTFTVEAYDLASYDYNDANKNEFMGYELEHGDYTFFASANSHVAENAYDSEVVTLAEDVRFENDTTTGTKVENLFTTEDYFDIQYRLSDVRVNGETRKGMSRTNFEGTFPTAPTLKDRVISFEEKGGMEEQDALASYAHNNPVIDEVTEMPATGKTDSELILHDLLQEDNTVDYDDARWEELLDKLTVEEMRMLVSDGAFKTNAIESIGKNLTNDSDGPIGFVNFIGGATSAMYEDDNNFTSEIVIGSTWNKTIAYEMGRFVGENGLWGDAANKNNGLPFTGWYAPAVNLHRSPFSGRNFEYYSEDPIISGKMAVNVINGAHSKGVYADLKHFALNDQETNRGGVSTYCTEQALRELYLKPFELAVKGHDTVSEEIIDEFEDVTEATKFVGTLGIMSSFNRIGTRWTGGDYRLMTQVLRNEWGFRGLVICDYKTERYMDSRQMLYAGNDLILTSTGDLMWTDVDANSAKDVTILRQSAKNILYAVANSNSIQINIIGYQTEWWVTLIIALDVVIPVLLAAWGVFAIMKFIRRKKS